jgi:hypothetical protein
MSIRQSDVENYGADLIDMSRRAAAEVLSPALQQLRQENNHLRQLQQRTQNAAIEQALDRSVPTA